MVVLLLHKILINYRIFCFDGDEILTERKGDVQFSVRKKQNGTGNVKIKKSGYEKCLSNSTSEWEIWTHVNQNLKSNLLLVHQKFVSREQTQKNQCCELKYIHDQSQLPSVLSNHLIPKRHKQIYLTIALYIYAGTFCSKSRGYH